MQAEVFKRQGLCMDRFIKQRTMMIRKEVSLSGVDDHDARAKLLDYAKPPQRVRGSGEKAEDVVARGMHAVEKAQKRMREAQEKMTRPEKRRKMLHDIAHHEKQSRMHSAEAERIKGELAALESEGDATAPAVARAKRPQRR